MIPGVNKNEILSLRNIENWKENQTLDAFKAKLINQTFDLKDILKNMTFGQGNNFQTILSFKVGQTMHKNSLLEIIEVYSERGRCYSIHMSNIITIEESIRLEFISNR